MTLGDQTLSLGDKTIRKAIALPLLMFGATAVGQAQETKPPCALGFSMGKSIAEDTSAMDSSYYKSNSDYFSKYLVYRTRETGVVYKVVALQYVYDPDQYGNDHRRAFDDLTETIVTKYGEPENKYDFLQSGSVWDEPKDWLMGLRQKERQLTWTWELPQLSITVEAKPSYVALTYEFSCCIDVPSFSNFTMQT